MAFAQLGKGGHEATRVAWGAGSSEILVSVAMVGDPGVRVTTPVPHILMLKGVNHGERTTYRVVWWHCFIASLGDGLLILGIFAAGWIALGRQTWIVHPGVLG